MKNNKTSEFNIRAQSFYPFTGDLKQMVQTLCQEQGQEAHEAYYKMIDNLVKCYNDIFPNLIDIILEKCDDLNTIYTLTKFLSKMTQKLDKTHADLFFKSFKKRIAEEYEYILDIKDVDVEKMQKFTFLLANVYFYFETPYSEDRIVHFMFLYLELVKHLLDKPDIYYRTICDTLKITGNELEIYFENQNYKRLMMKQLPYPMFDDIFHIIYRIVVACDDSMRTQFLNLCKLRRDHWKRYEEMVEFYKKYSPFRDIFDFGLLENISIKDDPGPQPSYYNTSSSHHYEKGYSQSKKFYQPPKPTTFKFISSSDMDENDQKAFYDIDDDQFDMINSKDQVMFEDNVYMINDAEQKFLEDTLDELDRKNTNNNNNHGIQEDQRTNRTIPSKYNSGTSSLKHQNKNTSDNSNMEKLSINDDFNVNPGFKSDYINNTPLNESSVDIDSSSLSHPSIDYGTNNSNIQPEPADMINFDETMPLEQFINDRNKGNAWSSGENKSVGCFKANHEDLL